MNANDLDIHDEGTSLETAGRIAIEKYAKYIPIEQILATLIYTD